MFDVSYSPARLVSHVCRISTTSILPRDTDMRLLSVCQSVCPSDSAPYFIETIVHISNHFQTPGRDIILFFSAQTVLQNSHGNPILNGGGAALNADGIREIYIHITAKTEVRSVVCWSARRRKSDCDCREPVSDVETRRH